MASSWPAPSRPAAPPAARRRGALRGHVLRLSVEASAGIVSAGPPPSRHPQRPAPVPRAAFQAGRPCGPSPHGATGAHQDDDERGRVRADPARRLDRPRWAEAGAPPVPKTTGTAWTRGDAEGDGIARLWRPHLAGGGFRRGKWLRPRESPASPPFARSRRGSSMWPRLAPRSCSTTSSAPRRSAALAAKGVLSPDEQALLVRPAQHLAWTRSRGRRPTSPSSTRRGCCSGPRRPRAGGGGAAASTTSPARSATSWSTRPRTCRPCSCACGPRRLAVGLDHRGGRHRPGHRRLGPDPLGPGRRASGPDSMSPGWSS